MKENNDKNNDLKTLPINQETLDIIVANVIPTSKYFEIRFDHLENRVNSMQDDIKDFRADVDKRFDDFKSDVDKRFEQVDKRFEQVDKRFEQVIYSIDRLTDKLDNRDKEHRSFTMRMFSISIMISFLGVLGMFFKLFQIV